MKYTLVSPSLFHFLFENTHQHLHYFFHMHINFIWNMCTYGWLCASVRSPQALLFLRTFHIKFYFNLNKLSYLYFSVCTTHQYFVRAGGVLIFGGSLSEGLCSLFRRNSQLFFGAIDTTNLLCFGWCWLVVFCMVILFVGLFSSVVFVGFCVCLKWC